MSAAVLVARDLWRIHQPVRALGGVSLPIMPAESLAIVGESGSGKSTLLRCLAGLERPDAGTVQFAGADVFSVRGERRRRFCQSVQLVLQDASRSLNPAWKSLALVREPMDLLRRDLSGPERDMVARRWMERVGLPASAAERLPGELSGGQRQRLLLARAMTLNPAVLLLDEPLAGLDPPVQRGILDLLTELRAERPLATVLVTHSMSAAVRGAEEIAVMREGVFVERRSMAQFLAGPSDPYSREILAGWRLRQANFPESSPIKSGDPAH